MRAILQRVLEASVTINQKVMSKINYGLLILIGIEDSDNETDIDWLINKIVNLRIFNDENGIMNISIQDTKGEILVVSQFTLYASTKKGNRPSYIIASKPNIAIPIYELFIDRLQKYSGLTVKTGKFGADMKVSLINDGPVTIIMDSKNKK
jgi:D-aminoacyl-tRNA deacylase